MSLKRIRPFVHGAAVFTFGVAACDSRELLAPNGRSLAPRSYINEPQSLGSGFLAAPPNTSPASVTGIGWDPLQVFPDSAWVVVNVTGNISLTYNKAPCDSWAETMPFWACMTGDPFDGFGSQPWDGGTLSIRAYYDGGGGGYTGVKLRGTGGTGAVGLFFASGAGSLTGRYNMRALWAWDPTYGTGPWSYNIAGGYTVTATAVPAPFQVTESAPDADGVVTYTVEPLYGLQFTTPVNGWPGGATFWAFYPGDSLPDRPDRSWPGWQITECQFHLVCRWKPPVAGRMQVLAHLEEQSAYARSKPETPPQCASLRDTAISSICAPSATLSVQCRPDTLVVGDSSTCTATVTPTTASVVVQAWHFAGDSLGVTADTMGDVKAWTFHPTVCGTVSVTATIDGAPTTANARVEVVCNFLNELVNDDPFLNSATIQNELRRLWTNTLSSGVEQGSVITRRNGVYTVIPYRGPSDRCNSRAGAITIMDPDTMVAFIHTHPDASGVLDPCGVGSREYSTDGPSTDDNKSVRRVRGAYASVPGYIVDPDHIHRYGSTELRTRRWSRNGKCP